MAMILERMGWVERTIVELNVEMIEVDERQKKQDKVWSFVHALLSKVKEFVAAESLMA